MIHSLLDSDLYKFTMGQVFFKKYKNIDAAYSFICRNKDINLSFLRQQIEEEVKRLGEIKISEAELSYLKTLGFFENDYLNYLKDFKLNPENVQISTENEKLQIRVTGKMVDVSPWEIYLLSTINELYFKNTNPDLDVSLGKERLKEKIALIKNQDKNFKFMEFGTRRRFSQSWQEEVTRTLKEQVPDYLIGTSNVLLAMKLGIKPVGTLAHEYLQSFQALAPELEHFQKTALKTWQDVYQDKLLIALTDVITTDAFLNEFDEALSHNFQGLRHDSGDPIVFGEKALSHYKKYNIDAKNKTLVFSDGLDFPKSFKIFNHFKEQTNMVFGIGTNLTNDLGPKALNIVLKMVSCNHMAVAKISDEPSKAICEDPDFLKKLKLMFGVKE